jgi:MSHA biogenesis protein MshP
MYLNTLHKSQKGFLLPVALFLIVVLGGMAIIISKKISQSTSTYLLNSISAQTFYAAESGAQAGLHELFYADKDRQLADGRCAAMNISQTLNLEGLKNCAVSVSCQCHYENGSICEHNNNENNLAISATVHSFYSFYSLDSVAQCGVEPVVSYYRMKFGVSL